MDPETAAGQRPQECANEILRATLRGDNENMPIKYLPAVWLRALLPSIYFAALNRRAIKLATRHNVTQTV